MLNIFCILFTFLSIFFIEGKKTIQKGSPAPEFSCMGDDNKVHNLAQYKGKKVIIYFYPHDGTQWCTQQAQGFRDHFDIFERNNIIILGISCNSVQEHKAFKLRYNLPFTLLSDPQSKVFTAYGIKGIFANSRATYVIDELGTIIEIFSNISPKTHAQDIIKYLSIT